MQQVSLPLQLNGCPPLETQCYAAIAATQPPLISCGLTESLRCLARDVRAELRALSRMGVGYAFGFRAQPVLDGISRIATSGSHPFTGAPHAMRAGCAARHEPEVSLTWHLSSAAAER
jgi:hypothetical protein